MFLIFTIFILVMNTLAHNMTKLAVYYVTAPSREVALKISEQLLN